jgi:homoserine kinase
MSTNPWIEVFAPATVANLGPGYDVLGLALERPGDRVRARRCEEPGVRLTRVTGDHALPPAGPHNTAAVAARLVLERLDESRGMELELHKGLPIGSGLGSSGASAAAAARATDLLCGTRLPEAELVQICAAAEAVACGSAHPDNVAPALLGGITLVREPSDVVRIELPETLELHLALVSPHQELPTRLAREAIPEKIPLADAVHNSAHLAALVYGLASGDLELVRRSMHDRIAEPRRAHLIEGFAEVKAAALDAGALGASISGAGPSIFALCADRAGADRARGAMSDALTRLGRPHDSRVSGISPRGARQVDR